MILVMLSFRLALLAGMHAVHSGLTRLAYLHSEHAVLQNVIYIAIDGHWANKLVELLCTSNAEQLM